MSTEDIYNYVKVNERLITAGQPTAEQLQAAADEGYDTVINLAVVHIGSPLPNEADVVHSLGMAYHHIPVDWNNPTDDDFNQFEQVMNDAPENKVLLHCAANFRVTAFYSLYAMKNLRWSEAQAEAFRDAIWAGSDYPVWETFVARKKAEILAE